MDNDLIKLRQIEVEEEKRQDETAAKTAEQAASVTMSGKPTEPAVTMSGKPTIAERHA